MAQIPVRRFAPRLLEPSRDRDTVTVLTADGRRCPSRFLSAQRATDWASVLSPDIALRPAALSSVECEDRTRSDIPEHWPGRVAFAFADGVLSAMSPRRSSPSNCLEGGLQVLGGEAGCTRLFGFP